MLTMLVLSRRPNEKIVFPGLEIAVKVLDIRPGRVRLGIDAPTDVTVLREELPDRMAEWGELPLTPREQEAEARFYRLNKILRHRLLAVGADLKLLRRQVDAGLLTDAAVTIDKMQSYFEPIAL